MEFISIRKLWNNFCIEYFWYWIVTDCWVLPRCNWSGIGQRHIKALTALRIWQDNSCSLFLRTYLSRGSGEIIRGWGWEAGKSENKPKISIFSSIAWLSLLLQWGWSFMDQGTFMWSHGAKGSSKTIKHKKGRQDFCFMYLLDC